MARQAKASYYVRRGQYIVHPYTWPAGKVLVFTNERDMVEWSHDNRIVLKDAMSRPGWR